MSEQVQMDVLAYGSRMIRWAPLGKLLFTFSLLILALLSDNILVPIITFCAGICLMAYSTNFRLPPIIGLAIAEAILIMVVGCGMVSILGDPSEPSVFLKGTEKFLWIDIHITENSFNHAWLIMFRAIAGVTLMLSFASSTPIPHMAYALSQLRIPKEVIEIVVLVYRYAFLLLERTEVMWNAAKCRLGFSGLKRSMSTTAGILVNVFITSLEIAERSQPALESRNYNGSFPIYRMPNKIGLYWFAVTAAACISLYVFGYFVPAPNIAALLLGVV
ncbi:MAG: cobalt ECF transporter T component CbiQ [Candidatus Methanomethylophilaceae archaeon]|jgi:cobalt ECF transporter T component CbiQ